MGLLSKCVGGWPVRVLCLGLVLISACDSVAVTTVRATKVDVFPTSAELVTGQSVQFSALALDGAGSQLSTAQINWTVSPAEIAQIDAAGRVTALAPGLANVTASTGGVVGSASVSVGVPGVLALSSSQLTFSAIAGEPSPSAQTLAIGAGDDGVVMGLATNVVYGSGSSGWLSASLSSDRAPAILTVRSTTGSLQPGRYSATVEVLSNSATNSPMTVEVDLVVDEAVPVIELVPSNLVFSGPQTKSLQVLNGGPGDLTELSAAVEHEPGDPTGWLTVALSETTAPSTLVASTDDTSLRPGTYTARIVVQSGNPAVVPQTVSVTLNGGQQSPTLALSVGSAQLSAPAGSTATASVNVSNGGSGDLDGLGSSVAYAAGQPTGWLVASLSSTNAPAVLRLNASTAGLSMGTYNASVEVAGNASNSPVILPVSFTVTPQPVQPPAAPSNLTATAGSGAPTVTLGWSDNSTNESSFRIRRRQGGSSWQVIDSVGADAAGYSDTSVTAGASYDYQVQACNGTGCSAWSGTASVTVPAPPPPPPPATPKAPSKLTATATGPWSVTLTWQDKSDNESGFEVRKRGPSGAWQVVHTTAANATSYIDSNVSPGQSYDYQVRACAGTACSKWTGTVTVVLPVAAPAAPTALVVTGSTSSTVTLGWTDNSSTETRFEIRRRNPDGSTLVVGTAAANATSFVDSTVAASAPYDYQVQACNASACSTWTNTASVTTPAGPTIPRSPSQLTVVAASPVAVVLTWSDDSTDETHFIIEEGSASSAWTVIGQVPANFTLFADLSVIRGQLISYHVKACNAAGCSGSQTVSVLVP